jgi:hypothetical protein
LKRWHDVLADDSVRAVSPVRPTLALRSKELIDDPHHQRTSLTKERNLLARIFSVAIMIVLITGRKTTNFAKRITTDAGKQDHDDDKRKTIAEFRQAVNMTPAQLEKWLDTEDPKRVGQKRGSGESVGHQSGRRIIGLLHKPAADLSEDDLGHMHKVVGYVHRHLAQGPSKIDPATSDWRYSLMNWGHDPQKD